MATDLKPRLNKQSLKVMAIRHRTSIQASAIRSRLLSILSIYLHHLISLLDKEEHHIEDLINIEKDLEAIEAALIHVWISFPYNETLKVPRGLSHEHVDRLKTLTEEGKRMQRHLKIATSKAA